MTFNLNEPIFQKNLQFGDIWPRNRQKIAQTEVFGHFLDFASLVFLDLAHNDRWAWCLVVFLQFASPVSVFLLNSEITLDGFKKPYRLDITASSGGLLIYVKASLLSKIINHYDFQKDIQCIAMELNVTNKKYVIFSIYRPPKQNINYFLNSLPEGLDFYLKHYENNCILGDFNATPSNLCFTLFLENQN